MPEYVIIQYQYKGKEITNVGKSNTIRITDAKEDTKFYRISRGLKPSFEGCSALTPHVH